MNASVAGFIAEIAMQKLERTVLPDISRKLRVRSVDDTFVIIKKRELQRAIQLIKSVSDDIKFTMEEENNNKLAVLDVLVTRLSNGQMQTEVHRKATHTDQILSYDSNHPKCHKQSCIRILLKRTETHCNTVESKVKEEKRLYRIFQRNGYPRNFIWRSLRKCNSTNATTRNTSKTITLPYIKNISEMTARILRQHAIKVAHRPTDTLRRVLSKPKGTFNAIEKTNVIYKIQCNDCEKHYVGQTGRKLLTRITEHKLVTKRHEQFSLISAHEDGEGHHFDWNNVRILGQARTKKEREFMEAWYSTGGAINRHIEIDPAYQPLRTKETQNHRTRGRTRTQRRNQ
ncbi:hypothetical protein T265_01382 [Opisthorchis viverrini]|uniref:Helix-turn-helix domain-containing protein n=1 Tax=Opisthorchis viverrini TaxID=6198 RepID=A0A075A2M5_OPIVI|nr:hypothetical protein T265_01382 [Opisthorchis viverrini]KER32502.1 hypothetical protein T265_01382 [Opisthorchis viverrini]